MGEPAKRLAIYGIEVIIDGIPDMAAAEATRYVDFVKGKSLEPVKRLEIRPEPDGRVGLFYTVALVLYEKVKRVKL